MRLNTLLKSPTRFRVFIKAGKQISAYEKTYSLSHSAVTYFSNLDFDQGLD